MVVFFTKNLLTPVKITMAVKVAMIAYMIAVVPHSSAILPVTYGKIVDPSPPPAITMALDVAEPLIMGFAFAMVSGYIPENIKPIMTIDSPITNGEVVLMNNNIARSAPRLMTKVIAACETDLLILPVTIRPAITINQSVDNIFWAPLSEKETAVVKYVTIHPLKAFSDPT